MTSFAPVHQLSDGATAPRDILNIKGPFAVQEYLVNGVQEVYRSQGITINNKHIEVIVRQMMRRLQIEDAGDTPFLEGEAAERYDFLEVNDDNFDKKVITDPGESNNLNLASWLRCVSCERRKFLPQAQRQKPGTVP